MRFFGREKKIEKLRAIRDQSASEAQFTVITGRRRVGKTELVKQAYRGGDFAYLFVSHKSEADLVAGFVEETNRAYPDSISPEIHSLEGFFKEVFKLAKNRSITVFIDEFQDFRRINPSFFSILQGLWDREHGETRLNLVVCGSINTLMNEIFLKRKEPLYGRQTVFLRLEPFPTDTLKEILRFHKKDYASEDLLALWTFTGGIAKYVALLMDAGATDFAKMLDVAINEDSFFLEEGKILLGDEFGKDYSIYFSILSAMARGVTARNEIEQVVGRQIGGYLTRLEEDYHLVSKHVPFGAKTMRQVKYQIDDPFYRFWFRFIFKYDYMVQMKSFELLKKIIARDYPTFSGVALERYFQKKFAESGDWTRIGNWWDRKGENELDLVAEDELSGRFVVAEVKRDKSRIDLANVREKFGHFARAVGLKKGIAPEFKTLSMDDM